MSKKASVVTLTGEQEHALTQVVQSGVQSRMAERARLVLLASEGRTTREIAEAMKVRPATVSKWRQRFAMHGMSGLDDAFRSGRARCYGSEIVNRVLRRLSEAPPSGAGSWTGDLLARSLGVSSHQVWRILDNLGISLRQHGSRWLSTAAEFSAKAIRLAGLYLDPPQNMLVVSGHEPGLRTAPPVRGWMRLPDRVRLPHMVESRECSQEMTLVAGLEAVLAQGGCERPPDRSQHRLAEFLQAIIAGNPETDLFAIVQGLDLCDGALDGRLLWHDRLTLHHTSFQSEWLRDVELCLLILQRRSPRQYASIRALVETIDRFVHQAGRSLVFEWRAEVVPIAPVRREACV
jgi:transposase